MRVTGNIYPPQVTVEEYRPKPGMAEVRLTENVTQVDDNAFTYDEYVLRVPNRDGLYEEVEANINDWLATGRVLEINEGASLVQDMKTAMATLGYKEE